MYRIITRHNLKIIFYNIVGFFFIFLGILGLFLPILQGLIFIALGLSILATHNRYFEQLKLRMYRNYPRTARFSKYAKRRLRGIFIRVERSVATPAEGPVRPIVYYVSCHGYGHAARTCDIIAHLREIHPEISVIIRSKIPAEFFNTRLNEDDYTLSPSEFDVGLLQIDSIRSDVEGTLDKIEQLYAQREDLIKSETEWLRDQNAGIVVSDIPAIPLAAAANAEIPSLAVANFSWDWIYSDFTQRDPRWNKIVEAFAEDYALTDLLLRLPFSGPMQAFPVQKDVGLVAESGLNQRKRIANETGADRNKKWILVCFTALKWEKKALARIEEMSSYEFFILPPLYYDLDNIHQISHEQHPFKDLIASVDGVLSKPGYGIMSDCIANAKPLVYTPRENFLEYEILVKNIERYIQNTMISTQELYTGDLQQALDRLWKSPKPFETPPRGGAKQIVREIVERGYASAGRLPGRSGPLRRQSRPKRTSNIEHSTSNIEVESKSDLIAIPPGLRKPCCSPPYEC